MSMNCTTVRSAPMTKCCARANPCQREMPIAIRMSPNAKPRSNHDTSIMERLAVAELSMKGSISLFFGIEKGPNPRGGGMLEHVHRAAAGSDPPALQHNRHIARTARFG